MDKESEARTVAAVDLGSNSFHMIVARLEESGTLSIIDRLREPVRLGGGLKRNGKLSRKARDRALDCLEQIEPATGGCPYCRYQYPACCQQRRGICAGSAATAWPPYRNSFRS